MTPSRNNRGVAHENGSVESAHGHLKKIVRDALLMRGSAAFDDLATYRRFIDEVIAAKNRRAAARIDAERAHLKLLPDRRTSDYEEVIVTVTKPPTIIGGKSRLMRKSTSALSAPSSWQMRSVMIASKGKP